VGEALGFFLGLGGPKKGSPQGVENIEWLVGFVGCTSPDKWVWGGKIKGVGSLCGCSVSHKKKCMKESFRLCD